MHAVEIAKNDLRLNVRNAFLSVLEADAQVKVLEESRARAEERLRKATAELNAGTSARVDVLRFETQLKQAEVDLFAGKNSLQLAKNSFNNTLARPIETPVQLSTAHIGELITDETLVDTLVAHALKFRPELKSVRYQLMALRNIRKATEGGLKPSLSFNATHQRNIDAQGFSSKSTSTFGTLALSLPLFDSGLTRAKVKQAREDEYQATQQLAQAELGISLDVRQAYTNYLFASQRLALATKAEESALETHRISKLRNDVHEGIVLEVIDSQTELTRAKTAVVLATYDQLKALAALQHALGTDGLIGGEQK